MITDLSSLYRDFLKSELIDIAQELSLVVSGDTTTKVLVSKIIADIEANGVPEVEDCSDVMLQFLVAAEVCDEDGNLISGAVEQGNEEAVVVSEDVQEKLPDCYGFEDDRDPACNRCKVKDACKAARIQNRPPCFGKLFEEHDENCGACIESPFCSLVFIKSQKQISTKKGK